MGAPLPTGQVSLRPAVLGRWNAHLALGDWRDIRARLADTEAQMCAVLEELGLAELVTTIAELTMTGAAAHAAPRQDPGRASPDVPRGTHLTHMSMGSPARLLSKID